MNLFIFLSFFSVCVHSIFLPKGYNQHNKYDGGYDCDPANPPGTTKPPSPTTPAPPTLGGNCPNTIGKPSNPNPPLSNSCDDGWTAFRRIKGVRCLKTFTGTYNQPTAQRLCGQQNAVLAGIENSNERDWIHQQFIHLASPTPSERTVWIGGYRKPECMVLKDFPASCLPKETQMFYWTDPSVTGTDGFCPWWDTDPDNYEGKALQPCVQFTILKDATPVGQWNATQGSLDDVVCGLAFPALVGYVCSKPANV